MLKTTPLYEDHKKQQAKIIAYAGWKMPVEFSKAKEEHLAVRRHCGLFDVSHMGEISVQGKEALCLLSLLTVNNLAQLNPKACQYTLICNENGGIIDDLIIYCLEKPSSYLLCVNAGRSEKITQWIKKQNHFPSVQVQDVSEEWGQIAVQGPDSAKVLSQVLEKTPTHLKKFHFDFFSFLKTNLLISRTGYTGEDGFEILSPPPVTLDFWKACLKAQALRVGLAARDTLRLEMKFPLYGQDMDETINPMEMGLGWVCKNKEPFIGKPALTQKISRKWVGFEVTETPSGIPRSGYTVYSLDGRCIGRVTSGVLSPSLGKIIGTALVDLSFSSIGCVFHIAVHGKRVSAQVVRTPFLQKKT